MSEVLLGIDIGSQSTKGVLARPDGEVVATASRQHRLSLPRPGWVEHDPEAVWWEETVAVARELLASGERPAGVCVSGIGPCLLPADASGTPLRAAILYGIDTRATREIEELEQMLGSEAILARGGSPLSSQAVGPKLLWLRHHEPEVWERTRLLLMASSQAVLRLCGEYVLDRHSASQCDPLFDLEAGEWAPDWAELVAPGLRLPRLVDPDEVIGTVDASAAAVTGIPAGTPVVAGTIDAWAESLSAGARHPGDVMAMYASTLFLIAVVERPLRDPALWSTVGVEPGSWSLAAGMATSGTLVRWLQDLAPQVALETLLSEAAGAGAGAGGLLALPYFAGERTPIHDPCARGVICGLTLRHGIGDVARALLEAVAFAVRHNLEAIAAAGASPRRLVAVGGGTRGPLLTRIVSDVTGLAQDVCAETAGAAHGGALLAARGAGLADAETEWNTVERRVEPDPSLRPLYDELYELYRDLYPATRRHSHALAALAERGTTAPGADAIVGVGG